MKLIEKKRLNWAAPNSTDIMFRLKAMHKFLSVICVVFVVVFCVVINSDLSTPAPHHVSSQTHSFDYFFSRLNCFAVVPFFFIQKLISLISDLKPSSVFVALDVGKSFRKKISPGYKAHRPPMPVSLREQVQRTNHMAI